MTARTLGLQGDTAAHLPARTPSPGTQPSESAGSTARQAAQTTGQSRSDPSKQASRLGPNPEGASTTYRLPLQPWGLRSSRTGRKCSLSYTYGGGHPHDHPRDRNIRYRACVLAPADVVQRGLGLERATKAPDYAHFISKMGRILLVRSNPSLLGSRCREHQNN
ncbi:hypothetical protein NDU88_000283 [Pleurodeles waltl]|uniref:Uncharacterized protein n=1 Tax=Pleurodeles waltl TaxID=8319 RepID=A0AAV7S962_PLEWA|nr:hypothetical protein NDU88_000283 [Pleurodeles waltl]